MTLQLGEDVLVGRRLREILSKAQVVCNIIWLRTLDACRTFLLMYSSNEFELAVTKQSLPRPLSTKVKSRMPSSPC